jgi:hypothetical protein
VDSNESQQKEHAIVERIRSLRKRMTSSMNSPNGNTNGCNVRPLTLELWERTGKTEAGIRMLRDVV